MNNERVADLFIDQGLMDRAQADDVLLETTQNGKPIEQAMVDLGIVDEAQFYHAIADALGTEVIDLDAVEFTPRILRLIPAGLARLHHALPIGEEGTAIRVALVDPLDSQTVDDLRFALGRDIEVVLAPSLQIEERLRADVTTERRDDLREAAAWMATSRGVGVEDLTVANDRPIRQVATTILKWLGWM